MSKIKVGVIFGGNSREREVSFAGGRTVYDNLNKSLFEPIPIFIDSFGNFVELDWQYLYKGSIRDFYPPVDQLPESLNNFQVYAESLNPAGHEAELDLLASLGKVLPVESLPQKIDFAFLCLHGSNGEDGRLQGLLEYIGVPYSGSGILSSAIGINKVIQKQLMVAGGFKSPPFISVKRKDWIEGNCKGLFSEVKKKIGFPVVIKPAHQGSSVGVTILSEETEHDFMQAVEKALFTLYLTGDEWKSFNNKQKVEFVRLQSDIREGLGLPIKVGDKTIYHPEELLQFLDEYFAANNEAILEAIDGESEVLLEGFIEGKEFSCIVIEGNNGEAIALPPTEIRKGNELFDYRSKYLPGLSRKITPINVDGKVIDKIKVECKKLYDQLKFDVYARIDGFIATDGSIFLNDPNTTSGMMPSSFFFHQAAEIGLNPSQFITYIIRASLVSRSRLAGENALKANLTLERLVALMKKENSSESERRKIAVIFGGYSSERHISVESGRNVFEKLASSSKYEPIPVFLTGDENQYKLYKIPINLMLKDNADDIAEKVGDYKIHPVIKSIIEEANAITSLYASKDSLSAPEELTFKELGSLVDCVFIALHGRPGEDGAIQLELKRVGLPFNGSEVESSQVTINKYETNELLSKHGLLIAKHKLISEESWSKDHLMVLQELKDELSFPLIAKPVDDGCSSAVKVIKSNEEFEAFAKLMFRKSVELDADSIKLLGIKPKEEFPMKRTILVEELIQKKDARHFLEITGGMLTSYDQNGEVVYEIFEPSETLTGGEVLSLEEKFLAGEGQNITPARYASNKVEQKEISRKVRAELERAARVLNIQGYARIDAFVRIYNSEKVEVIFIEVNSLPGMTPATCIFHQCAINGYKPYEFIDTIMEFSFKRNNERKHPA